MLLHHIRQIFGKRARLAGGRRHRPTLGRRHIEMLEGRALLSHASVHVAAKETIAQIASARRKAAEFVQTNLISDGFVPAAHTDPDLVNPWGLTAVPTGTHTEWWISDNGTGVSTLNLADGTKLSLVVTVPPPAGSPAGTTAAPSGTVSNNNASEFLVNGPGTAAHFLFSTEDGTISAWNSGTSAVLKIDNSAQGDVFKGLTIANNGAGDNLYATDFHNGAVDVFNGSFRPVGLAAGAFTDPKIPGGFAPFGIQAVTLPGSSQTDLVVTFARQDGQKHDDSAGPGRGFVDLFDTSGNLLARVGTRGTLNSPWGIAVAPSGLGQFGNDLLIGNFGDGRINAFKAPSGSSKTFQFAGQLKNARGTPLTIQNLWGIAFGNGGQAGPTSTLYFTAGTDGEAHGLFGSLTSAAT